MDEIKLPRHFIYIKKKKNRRRRLPATIPVSIAAEPVALDRGRNQSFFSPIHITNAEPFADWNFPGPTQVIGLLASIGVLPCLRLNAG